jgi:hypothetical protein
MESSTREAREARARLYGATTTFADKKVLATSLLADLGGAVLATKTAGAGSDRPGPCGTATALVVSEWALAALAWAGLGADVEVAKRSSTGSVGRDARDNAGGGGGAANGQRQIAKEKPESRKNTKTPPPRAVGTSVPDATEVCLDRTLWHVLALSMRYLESQKNTSYKPNATATAHVTRAAAVAFFERGSKSDLLNLVTETLGLFEKALGGKFKPSTEMCLLALQASLTERDEHDSDFVSFFVRLTTRSVAQSPHKPPPPIDNATVDVLLVRAAAEILNKSSSNGSTTHSNDTLDFLRAVLLHPAHVETVPGAFAESARLGAMGGAALDLDTSTVGKKKTKRKAEGTVPEMKDSPETPETPDDDAKTYEKTPPPLVKYMANAITQIARGGDVTGNLLLWVFRSFVEGTWKTKGLAATTRGGAASSSGKYFPFTTFRRLNAHTRLTLSFLSQGPTQTEKDSAPSRLLWDSLFVSVSHHETAGNGRSNSTCFAPGLITELHRSGLYSQTSVGGGPAPAGGEAPRDRLAKYAKDIFCASTPVSNHNALSPETAARALRSLLEVDVRLVEPYLAQAIALVWMGDKDSELVNKTIAATVAAHADTRRLPELLGAIGAAASALNVSGVSSSETGGEGGATALASDEVLHAVAAASARVPPGQIKDIVAAARDATRAAFTRTDSATDGSKNAKHSNPSGKGKENGAECGATARVVATCAFVATLVSSLPAQPGASLPGASKEALCGFGNDLVSVARDFCVSIDARRGDDSASIGKSSKEPKKKRKRETLDASSNNSLDGFQFSPRDRVDAARVGAALVAFTAVAATLEVCHDSAALHGRHAAPYLCVDKQGGSNSEETFQLPSLARVAAWTLHIGGTRSALGGTHGADETVSAALGVGVAGACVHRLAQLAAAASPAPAGEGDAAAAGEAKALVDVLTTEFVSGGVSVNHGVTEVLLESEDVWTPWASAEALAEWTRGRDGFDAKAENENEKEVCDRQTEKLVAEPEILAARLFAAARDVVACSKKLLGSFKIDDSKEKSLVKACGRVIDDADSLLEGDENVWEAVGECFVDAFWRAVLGEKRGDEKKIQKEASASGELCVSLTVALVRLSSIPAGIAVRAMDSGTLVAVLAAADCVSCLVHGHACTSAGVTARRFAARLAETDAAAAERVAKFLPSLVQASAAEAASDHDTDIDSTPFAEATVAVASLTHRALANGKSDEDNWNAIKAVAAAVAPFVVRLAIEARASKTETTTPKKGLVPRAIQKKRKVDNYVDTTQISGQGARAAALAEAVLVALVLKIPKQTEASRYDRTEDPHVFAVAGAAREETISLRLAVDDALAALYGAGAFVGSSQSAYKSKNAYNRCSTLASASVLAAAGAGAKLASLVARHGDLFAGHGVDVSAVRVCVCVALEVLAAASRDESVSHCGTHVSTVVNESANEQTLVAAATAAAHCVSLLDATGPALDANAHAVLLAVVAAAYDAQVRKSSANENTDEPSTLSTLSAKTSLPAPSVRVKRALDLCMEVLLDGAGKRLLGAGYKLANEQLRDVDIFCRRLRPGMGSDLTRVSAAIAMPLWLLQHLVKGTAGASNAAFASHAETTFHNAFAPALWVAKLVLTDDASSHCVNIAITHACVSLTSVLVSKSKVALSSRCVARIAQTPSALASALSSAPTVYLREAVRLNFVPLCAALTSTLRFRKEELRRSAAIVVHACASLLDVLRVWHKRRVGLVLCLSKSAEGAEDSNTKETNDDVNRVDDACVRGANALVAVYEEAVTAGLDRYCAHLLADAVTSMAGGDGGGIGQQATQSLKPGVFALLDQVTDRELGQMHAAFGVAEGGARRVTLANLVEEHKRRHKYDGKV